jgi:hypothetical protein
MLMLLRHKVKVMSTIRKYNTLARNKNLVLCEKFAQQRTVKHSSVSANVSIFSTKLVLSIKLVTMLNVAISSIYTIIWKEHDVKTVIRNEKLVCNLMF